MFDFKYVVKSKDNFVWFPKDFLSCVGSTRVRVAVFEIILWNLRGKKWDEFFLVCKYITILLFVALINSTSDVHFCYNVMQLCGQIHVHRRLGIVEIENGLLKDQWGI